MEIGLIADTHGFLDPAVLKSFQNVDEIWHAGDFGSLEVAENLAALKPLRGVYGNIDNAMIRDEYPEDLRFEIEGLEVWITHIAGRPGRYDPRVRKKLAKNAPSLLVCGHSHILHVERDKKFGQMQFLNPGAAGHQGFHHLRTLLKFRIENGTVENIRLVELGPRGRTPKVVQD